MGYRIHIVLLLPYLVFQIQSAALIKGVVSILFVSALGPLLQVVLQSVGSISTMCGSGQSFVSCFHWSFAEFSTHCTHRPAMPQSSLLFHVSKQWTFLVDCDRTAISVISGPRRCA